MIVLEEVIPRSVLLFKENNEITDHLGKIVVFEDFNIFFKAKRLYVVSKVLNGSTRGHHAHKELHQFLVAINGNITIQVDDGSIKRTVVLKSQKNGLYIAPNVWRTMTWNDDSALLLVLASEVYEEKDYIREYCEFLRWVKNEANTI